MGAAMVLGRERWLVELGCSGSETVEMVLDGKIILVVLTC